MRENQYELIRKVTNLWPEYTSYSPPRMQLEYIGTIDPHGYQKVIQGTYHGLDNDFADAKLRQHMIDVISEICSGLVGWSQKRTPEGWKFVFADPRAINFNCLCTDGSINLNGMVETNWVFRITADSQTEAIAEFFVYCMENKEKIRENLNCVIQDYKIQ